MKDYSIEEKLTPAAKEILDEFFEDSRSLLLKEAMLKASDATGELREISRRNIFETLQTIKFVKVNNKKRKFQIILEIYLFLGIFFFISGAFLTEKVVLESYFSNFPKLISAFGFVFIVSSGFLMLFISYKNSSISSWVFSKDKTILENMDYSAEYILSWNKLERSMRELMANHIGESNIETLTLRELTKFVVNGGVFGSSASSKFYKMLDKRNSIVHSELHKKMSLSKYRELEKEIKHFQKIIDEQIYLKH